MTESGERTIETESDPAKDVASEIIDTQQPDNQDIPAQAIEEQVDSPPIPPKQSDDSQPESHQPDSPIENQKTELNQQDRDTILDASLHLFAQKGVYQTSLVDISTNAQCSKASLYKHFQNKEAIADALHCDLIKRLDQTLADIHENSSTSISCLRSIVEFLLDLTEQAPDVAQLLFCPKDKGLVQNKSNSESLPAFQRITEILKAGMNSGELEKINPKIAYCTFMGLLCSVINLHLENELSGSLDQHINDVWYPVWRALAKNPNRPS
jgi:AcrR family transcriptional regulator